jgi:ankyrin repeat protein
MEWVLSTVVKIVQISQLLVSAAHINVADGEGNTPLHLACEAGDPNVVERLLHGSFNVLTYTHCLAHHHAACRCFNQKPNLNKR